jgi:ribosomal protein L37E
VKERDRESTRREKCGKEARVDSRDVCAADGGGKEEKGREVNVINNKPSSGGRLVVLCVCARVRIV